jgi:hypothetical protein
LQTLSSSRLLLLGALTACVLTPWQAIALEPSSPASNNAQAVQAPSTGQSIAHISAAPPTALEWVQIAVQHQIEILDGDGQFMRYRQVRKDDNGDRLKDVVETREGFVSRTLERDGKPLNADANSAEVQHLQTMLGNPDNLARHHRREQSDLEHSRTMIQQMPDAMIWSFAPGLTTSDTIVLDYKSDPNYHPPSLEAAPLKCIAGRLWIDGHTQRMSRIETHLVQDCTYGWGIFVRVNSGGTIVLEQQAVDPTGSGHPHWEETHFEMHVTGSLLMLKHFAIDTIEDQSQFQPIPGTPSYADGIRLLLK